VDDLTGSRLVFWVVCQESRFSEQATITARTEMMPTALLRVNTRWKLAQNQIPQSEVIGFCTMPHRLGPHGGNFGLQKRCGLLRYLFTLTLPGPNGTTATLCGSEGHYSMQCDFSLKTIRDFTAPVGNPRICGVSVGSCSVACMTPQRCASRPRSKWPDSLIVFSRDCLHSCILYCVFMPPFLGWSDNTICRNPTEHAAVLHAS